MPFLPFVDSGQTLGLSPEQLSQYFQQFSADGFPSGMVNCGVMSDCAAVYQLSNAQLLALAATPVQILAPPQVTGLPSYLVPPNGFLYVPTTLTLQNKFGGTVFTIGNANNILQLEYTGQATSMLSILATGILDQNTNKLGTNLSAATGPIVAPATGVNLGLEVKLTGTTPALTLGTGTAILTVLFNIYALL